MSAHNANGTGNGNGDSPHYPSPLDVLSNAPRRGDAASFLLESAGPLQDSTEFRELAAARRDELLAKHAYQAEAYRAKQRQLARAEQWREAAREAEWKAVVEAAPAHLQESVAIQDFDFGRLWAEYNELNRPDQWYSYGGGFQQRKHGANWPFFRNEVELDWYRNASRWSITKSSHAPGFIGGVCGYVINKGHVCKPVPLDGTNDPRDARLVALLEHEFEQFSKRVGWAQLQQEIFCESFADGEYFLHLFDLGDHLEVRGILPELIRQPPGTLFDEWGFGIQAPPDDPWKKQAVHICDYDGGMGFVSSMDDVVYFPFRIPGRYNRGMKRCMPPLAFGTRDGFDHAEKLMRAMGIGVTIRQGFAYFEQWGDVPRETATGFVDDNSDVTIRRTGPNGTTTRDYTIAEPGKVIRGSPGMQFAALPSSPETSVAIEVADALLRRGGVILNAPPWLTGASGRDQGAYASDFVRESPAVKRWEMIQEDFGSGFLRVMEKVRDIAIRCGRLPEECRTRVKLTMEHPTLEARNKGEEASQNQTYVGMGAKSLQQIAAEQGWDYAKQRAEIKEKAQDDLKTQIELLDLQMQLERKKQELAALQQPPPGDGGGGAPSGEGPPDSGDSGGDDGLGAPPSPSLPGAEVGGDEAGTDLSPFGDIGESLADGVRVVAEVNESLDAALLLEGFTGVIKDKLGRTYHYQDGKRIAAAKAKEAGIDAESHPIKDAGKARAALKVVLDRGDVSEQHLADIAEHLPAMSVKDLRLMKAALMDRVAARDKEALIGRVREAAQKRVAESGENEKRNAETQPPVEDVAEPAAEETPTVEEPQQPVAGEPPTPADAGTPAPLDENVTRMLTAMAHDSPIRMDDASHPEYQSVYQAAELAKDRVRTRASEVNNAWRTMYDPQGDSEHGIPEGQSASRHFEKMLELAESGEKLPNNVIFGAEDGSLMKPKKNSSDIPPEVKKRAKKLAEDHGVPVIPIRVVDKNTDVVKGWAIVASPVRFESGDRVENTLLGRHLDLNREARFDGAEFPKSYKNPLAKDFDQVADRGRLTATMDEYAKNKPAAKADSQPPTDSQPTQEPPAAGGASTPAKADTQPAPDTAAPQSDPIASDPASSIRAVYDAADDLTQDSASIDAKLAVMDKLDKKALLGVAEKMELVGMQHKSLAAIRGAIRQKITDRRGQAQRRAMLDTDQPADPNLGIDDEAATGSASPTPQAKPAAPVTSPVQSIAANVLNPHVTDAQFTKQVADAVGAMSKSQMQAAYKELGFAAPLTGTPEQMKTKLSAAMTARRDQRLRAADGFAPDWSVHQAAAQVRSGEATPEQAAARLARDIMGQGGDAHVVQLLKEFGIKTPGDLGSKAGKQAAADAIAKAAVAKASEPAPAFTPANREAAPKPTAIDPARYVPPVNRDAVAGVKVRQRGPAKSHTVDSATRVAKQLFDTALASDWDEAKVQAEVDGLSGLSTADLNAVWKNLGGSATHANRESALKAIENLIVDRRGKHLRSKV